MAEYPDLIYLKDHIHDNLISDWEKEVEAPFDSHGLFCSLDPEDCILLIELAEPGGLKIMRKAYNVLIALGSGLDPKWVRYILDGQIDIRNLRITPISDLDPSWQRTYSTEEEFFTKYLEFKEKFENEYKLPAKWDCQLICLMDRVIVLASTYEGLELVTALVKKALFGIHDFEKVYAGIQQQYPDEKNTHLLTTLNVSSVSLVEKLSCISN